MARPRTFTDEERAVKRKEINDRRITFFTPIGFKEVFESFVGNRDIGVILLTMIKNDKEFKEFKEQKRR